MLLRSLHYWKDVCAPWVGRGEQQQVSVHHRWQFTDAAGVKCFPFQWREFIGKIIFHPSTIHYLNLPPMLSFTHKYRISNGDINLSHTMAITSITVDVRLIIKIVINTMTISNFSFIVSTGHYYSSLNSLLLEQNQEEPPVLARILWAINKWICYGYDKSSSIFNVGTYDSYYKRNNTSDSLLLKYKWVFWIMGLVMETFVASGNWKCFSGRLQKHLKDEILA